MHLQHQSCPKIQQLNMECPQIQLKCTRQSTTSVKTLWELTHRRFRSFGVLCFHMKGIPKIACVTGCNVDPLVKHDRGILWTVFQRSAFFIQIENGLETDSFLFQFHSFCWFVESCSCKNGFLLLEITRENWSNFSFAFMINVFETFKVHVLPQNVWP